MKLITCVLVCVCACMCACVCFFVCVSASTIWKRVMTLQNLWYFLDVRGRWQGKVSDGKRNAQCSHIRSLSCTLSVCLPLFLPRSLSLYHSDYLSLSLPSIIRGALEAWASPAVPWATIAISHLSHIHPHLWRHMRWPQAALRLQPAVWSLLSTRH